MTTYIPMPTDQMKFRVGGDTSDEAFLRLGRGIFASINAAAESVGCPIAQFRSVLDFGCGCGRVLRAWPLIDGQSVHGSDIDEDAIGYCREAFPHFSFQSNPGLPPTGYTEHQFDLIYSVSVFSHLREDHAQAWVKELRRIAAPGALLIISLHGMHMRNQGIRGLRHRLMKREILFERERMWKDHFPQWYGNLFLSEDGARRLFGTHFDIERHIPIGLVEHQDIIVLRAG